MLRIRLARRGRKNRPQYRVVVAEARWARDGRRVDDLGWYNPMTDPSTVVLDVDRTEDWIRKGAQPSERVTKLLAIAKAGTGRPPAPHAAEPAPIAEAAPKAAAEPAPIAEAAPKAAAKPAPIAEAAPKAPPSLRLSPRRPPPPSLRLSPRRPPRPPPSLRLSPRRPPRPPPSLRLSPRRPPRPPPSRRRKTPNPSPQRSPRQKRSRRTADQKARAVGWTNSLNSSRETWRPTREACGSSGSAATTCTYINSTSRPRTWAG